MQNPIVAFRGFGCTYPSQTLPTLHDINLDLRPGELTVLAGASGSGKTTLVQALNGILQHVLHARIDGEVHVAGRSVADAAVSELAATVGILFQEPESQFVSLYVRDEIAFGPENLLLPRDEIVRRMRSVMDRVGIADLGDRFVYELSGGQKQKVAVAGILAMEPRIIVLDEPTANLDPQSGRELWQLGARLRDEGLTVIGIEKHLEQVLTWADRLVVLDAGSVRFDGPPRDVIAEHGRVLVDELGLWLPQIAELEVLIRSTTRHAAPVIPLTADEARSAYASYEFASDSPGETTPGDMSGGTPLLRATTLTHEYPDGTMALRGVDLSIGPDEVVAICGANGSGKTTLVKHFVGLLRPTSGTVEVFGKRTGDLSVREIARHVGFVFQDPEHQFVKDSAADEIRFSLKVGGVAEDDRDRIVAEVLGLLDLQGLEDRHPFSLSGGQKRRLSVATAVVTRPDVLILDEPTYAQDRRTTIEMMRSIMNLVGSQETGSGSLDARTSAVVLVTHDMRLVADYATRAVVVSGGQIAFDGTPARLFEQPDLVERTKLEVPPIVQLVRELRAEGRLANDARTVAALAAAVR